MALLGQHSDFARRYAGYMEVRWREVACVARTVGKCHLGDAVIDLRTSGEKGRRTPSNWKGGLFRSAADWRELAFYCPNESAGHGPNHRVERVRVPRRSEAAHLTCSCGLRIVVVLECAGRAIREDDIYRVEGGELKRTPAVGDPRTDGGAVGKQSLSGKTFGKPPFVRDA